jgi:hypothetical protein
MEVPAPGRLEGRTTLKWQENLVFCCWPSALGSIKARAAPQNRQQPTRRPRPSPLAPNLALERGKLDLLFTTVAGSRRQPPEGRKERLFLCEKEFGGKIGVKVKAVRGNTIIHIRVGELELPQGGGGGRAAPAEKEDSADWMAGWLAVLPWGSWTW